METPRPARFFFDYVDPISYLMDREIEAALEGEPGVDLHCVPLELRPPPEPLLDLDGPWWRERWQAAVTIAATRDGVRLDEPRILPWTRKAHEFVAHARAKGLGAEAHRAVFEAVFLRGLDVGRVDVLVTLGRELGLDTTETKAVLDVDRWAEEVAGSRTLADEAEADEAPVLVKGALSLRGFHNRDAVRTFLRR